MDDTSKRSLTAVDRIADGSGLQIMKAAVPYLPYRIQKNFSLYIKLLEINNVISYYNHPISACSASFESASADQILDELRTYCTEEQRHTLDQTLDLLHTLKIYQECKDLF